MAAGHRVHNLVRVDQRILLRLTRNILVLTVLLMAAVGHALPFEPANKDLSEEQLSDCHAAFQKYSARCGSRQLFNLRNEPARTVSN
jgi:hypothetical protein